MIIRKISHVLSEYRNIMPLFAGACALLFLAGILLLPIPWGILDEILYNTRGLDTVVEPTILFIAFAIASYLYRKG